MKFWLVACRRPISQTQEQWGLDIIGIQETFGVLSMQKGTPGSVPVAGAGSRLRELGPFSSLLLFWSAGGHVWGATSALVTMVHTAARDSDWPPASLVSILINFNYPCKRQPRVVKHSLCVSLSISFLSPPSLSLPPSLYIRLVSFVFCVLPSIALMALTCVPRAHAQLL